MSTPSNLYAEKIYSEHPLVLWALDDKLDYISFISESQRQIYNSWTVTNATATLSLDSIGQPFPESTTTLIEMDVPISETLECSIVSDTITNTINFADLDTFTIGSYFYSNSIFGQTISIGYEYTDPDTLEIIQHLKTFPNLLFGTWSFISETFEIPDINVDIRVVFKIKIFEGSTVTTENQFYFNGLTLGQWNEEFNTSSLNGVTEITIPSNISLYGGLNAVEAQAYGIAEDSGYYMIDGGLKCKNTGIPLVYGANGVTRIEGTEGASLIIPGKGFLNKKGQYNDYTVEFWARIAVNTSTPFKIFGPIASNDGLYVENGSLTLVIGDQFASYSVGEWFRPMLIHIRVIRNSASLLINGEEVLSLSLDTASLSLPEELDNNGDNQDWLGFYGSPSVYPFEIDCVAIYSYQIPVTVAKRRWVYGQGVSSAQEINSFYGGATAFIDYQFANYTANYNYPDFAKWDQGTFDNLITTQKSLKTPEYSLPEIFIGTKTLKELYDDNKDIQENDSGPFNSDIFLSLRPNNTWNTINPYINFDRFNMLPSQIKSFYGVFSSHDLNSEEILFKIYNENNNNYFIISKNQNEIQYSLTYNGQTEILFTSEIITANSLFVVGLDIIKLLNSFGGDISAFFGNQNSLKLYVCGDDSGEYTFTGKLYSIGFDTAFNSSKITDTFNEEGFSYLENGQDLINHTASYTLLPTEKYGNYFLDIGVAGYWQDYMPLSYFGQFVLNAEGEQFYDLDFLQFNIGYPSTTSLFQESGDINYYYDTSGSEIKSYINFQYVENGIKIPTQIINEKPINEYRIIDLDDYEDWETARFEILNNSLIYPLKTVDFNQIAIVYTVEFNSRGILSKPIILDRLQIASQTFNNNSDNYIGTSFGYNLVPYKRNGIYYDYKSKNPFTIYKDSTPYLYLTETSGIKPSGKFNILENRGLSLPINGSAAPSFRVSSMQMWIKYDQPEFPDSPIEIFEINDKIGTLKFYLQANSNSLNRAKIFVLDQYNEPYNNLTFYINGNLVREPVISLNEWVSLGLSFTYSLLFDSYFGNINITGPVTFNNIAHYEATRIQEIISSDARSWFQVSTDGIRSFDWQYWLNNFTWQGMLFLGSTKFYGISLPDIHKTYIGTNKIIVDDEEGLVYEPEKLKVYSEVEWSSVVSTPV